MSRPRVQVALMNGGLGILPPSTFGTSLLMIASPVAPTAGYGVSFIIESKADVVAAFSQVGNEAVVTALVDGFFAEAPEGNTLYVVAMAATTSLTTMAAAANAEIALTPAKGAIRMVAFVKYPGGGYSPTVTNGFDADVHTCVTAAQILAAAWLVKKKTFRAFIAGFGCDGVAANALDYSTTSNRNCFIVSPSVNGDSGLATLLLLGRAVAVNPNQNIGRILSGSLNIDPTYPVTIGGNSVDTIGDTALDVYYAKRYLVLQPNEQASGYVVTDDCALTEPTDDYNNLAYGRVIDNMVRIADSVYYQHLKDDVDIDDNGRIDTVTEKALENEVINAINQQMGSQLSSNSDGTASVSCLVNPDTVAYAALYASNNISSPNLNLASGGQVYIFITGRPKGCLRNINIYLGYSLN